MSNVGFWLITGSLASIGVPYSLSSLFTFDVLLQSAGLDFFSGKAVFAIAFLIFFLIYFLVFQLLRKARGFRYPVTVLFFIYLAFGFSIDFFRDQTILRLVLSGTLLAISKTFWIACFQLAEVDHLGKRPFWEHFGTLNSPWQAGWGTNCIVRGYSDYLNHQVEDPRQVLAYQWSAVKLAFFCAVLKFIVGRYYDFFRDESIEISGHVFSGFSTYIGTAFSEEAYLKRELSRPLSWLFMTYRGFGFLVNLTAHTNMVVAIARMCKFSIKRNVYKPYLSTSFNNFLNRIYYFYIGMLQQFFFYPLLSLSRPLRYRNLRIFIVHFLTIFLGGFLSYFLRFATHWSQWGFQAVMDHVTLRLPYVFLLGLFSGMSALLPKLPDKYQKWPVLMALSACFCLLYFLCFSFNIGNYQVGIAQRIAAFLHLFGITI